MICFNCKEEKQNGEVIDDKFMCNNCKLSDMAKKIAGKKESESMIIAVLKHHGMRGDFAAGFYKSYPLERLIRCVWLFRYIKSTGYKISNDYAFLNTLLRDNKYPIPEGFWKWHKQKINSYDGKDFKILYKNI